MPRSAGEAPEKKTPTTSVPFPRRVTALRRPHLPPPRLMLSSRKSGSGPEKRLLDRFRYRSDDSADRVCGITLSSMLPDRSRYDSSDNALIVSGMEPSRLIEDSDSDLRNGREGVGGKMRRAGEGEGHKPTAARTLTTPVTRRCRVPSTPPPTSQHANR